MTLRFHTVLALAVTIAPSLMAQTPTDFTATVNITGFTPVNNSFAGGYGGVAPVGKSGNALIRFAANQKLDETDYNSGFGPISPVVTLAFNRLDQITVGSGQGIQNPLIPTANIVGGVSGGTGAYAGASSPAGTLRLTFTRLTAPQQGYRFSLIGAATVGGQQVDLAVTDALLLPTNNTINLFDTQTGTANITPFGNANVVIRSHPDTNNWETVNFIEINVFFNFSQTETLRSFFTVFSLDGTIEMFSPITITGGTGRFAGASGTGRVVSITGPEDNEIANIAGTLTLAGPSTPIITSVGTASGLGPASGIAQNGWIEIKGTNLVPASTPIGGMFWSSAPEFAQGRMPTGLGPVGVTINGKPAHIWWFCSAASGPSCPTDQINVLAPLDDYIGQVQVVVKNGAATSGVAMVNKISAVPTVLLFSAKGEPVATHSSGSLVGPTALYPGLSTPSMRGETVSLWGVGFGLPKEPLVPGSATQSGTLPGPLACTLAGLPAPVAAALVSPGLYQFNLTVPQNAPVGDDHLFCTYAGGVTPGLLLATQ